MHAFKSTDKQSLPLVTITILILNAMTVTLQTLYPQMLEVFQRNPEALAAEEWGRLITPMFVDPDPLWSIMVKFVGVAIIGFAVERRLKRFLQLDLKKSYFLWKSRTLRLAGLTTSLSHGQNL